MDKDIVDRSRPTVEQALAIIASEPDRWDDESGEVVEICKGLFERIGVLFLNAGLAVPEWSPRPVIKTSLTTAGAPTFEKSSQVRLG